MYKYISVKTVYFAVFRLEHVRIAKYLVQFRIIYQLAINYGARVPLNAERNVGLQAA